MKLNSWLRRWIRFRIFFPYRLCLSVVFLIAVTNAAFAADPGDPRWDPAPEILRKAGLLTKTDETAVFDDFSLTMDWFYMDELRAGFGFHLNGKAVPSDAGRLYIRVALKDALGQDIQFTAQNGAIVYEADGAIRGYAAGDLMPGFPVPVPPFELELTLNPDGDDWWDQFVLENPEKRSNTTSEAAESPALFKDRKFKPVTFQLETPVYPKKRTVLNQQLALNGFTVRLVQAETTPSATFLTICTRNDNEEYWSLIGDYMEEMLTLKSNGEEALLKSWQEVSNPQRHIQPPAQDDLDVREGEFCGIFGFYLGTTASPQHFSLEIPVMQLKATEGDFLNRLTKYQQDTMSPEFEFSYSFQIEPFSSSRHFELTKIPDGMSQSEAYRAFFMQIGTLISGPWKMEFSLK